MSIICQWICLGVKIMYKAMRIAEEKFFKQIHHDVSILNDCV